MENNFRLTKAQVSEELCVRMSISTGLHLLIRGSIYFKGHELRALIYSRF